MAVSTDNAFSGPYLANGVTTVFPFDFTAPSAAEVAVLVRNASGQQVGAGNYTVTVNPADGGNVAFASPPAAGGSVIVLLDPSFTQDLDFANGSAWLAEPVNEGYDRSALRDQVLRREAARAVKTPIGEDGLSIPPASRRAGRFFAFDAGGEAVMSEGSGADGALRSDLAAATGPGLVAFSPVTDYSAGSVGGKLAQLKAVNDYAAPADAAAADAEGEILLVARDAVSLIPDGASLNSKYWGFGQVRTADGNKRGKYFSALKAPPAVTGNSDSIDTAFNGDMSGHFVIEHRISGVGTLGTPATGYLYRNEAVPVYAVMYVAPEAGHNEQLTGNNGRTGTAIFRGDIKHYGNGDAVVYNGTAIVAGNKAGATSWLAQPAAVLFNGDMQAGAHHVYLNPRELHLKDSGFDVSCIGDVVNMNRTNGTGGQDVLWAGYRAQSLGTVAVNTLFSATGLFNCGIDLSMSFLQFGGNGAAISMKALDRIYFNNASDNDLYTTVFNGDWMAYIPGSGIVIATEGSATVQIADDRVVFTVPTLTPSLTVAALPAAIPENRGMECCVTNATSTTRGAVVAGGGANFVKVLCNGAAWIIQ